MFDFPNAPSNGQQVQGSAGQIYRWDGVKWAAQMGPGPLAINMGGTNATTAAQALANLGGISAPVSLTSQVSGILPVANGGTGSATAAAAPWVETTGDKMTGELLIQPAAGDASLSLSKSAEASNNIIYASLGATRRWQAVFGDGNGSNLRFDRFNDSGAFVDSPLSINRATGQTSFGGVLVNPAGAINITSTATGVVDQVMMNAIANAASDCFIRTTGSRIWAFGVKGTTSAGSFMIADLSAPASRITINPGGAIILDAAMVAPGSGVVASNCGFLSTGGGQTGSWDPLNGSKAACISLIDSGGAAGSGGAVEFGANGGTWKFGVIKGSATNGANFGVGEIQFWVRNVPTDGFLTKRGVLASDGVWYNTNASWSAISDRAMKENILPYTNGLAAIQGLEPVYFDYIEDAPFTGKNNIGLIAQQAAEFAPEIVSETEIDSMTENARMLLTTTPTMLIYTLINGMKELAGRVEMLEAR